MPLAHNACAYAARPRQAANAVIREILQTEGPTKARFLEQGIEARGTTPEEFKAMIRKEGERWGRVDLRSEYPAELITTPRTRLTSPSLCREANPRRGPGEGLGWGWV